MLSFFSPDVLTDDTIIEQSAKFSDMVIDYNPTTKQLSYTCKAFIDPKLHSAPLYSSFGKDEVLLSQSLAYIYSSCQRNKLIHPCLLPSLVLHCLKSSTNIKKAEELFSNLKQMFRIEFIFDPDKSSKQVNVKFKPSHLLFVNILFSFL